MQKKKLTVILSLVLIMTMLFGNISVMAADEVFTTAPTTQPGPVETTTSVTGEEEYPDGYWDGYYDGYEDGYEDGKNDDYDSGYEDGYYDGNWEGYEDGYYEGFYDGVNSTGEPTIFEKWDDFRYELQYRIEMFFARIKAFFEKLFKIGDYSEVEISKPDKDFIPDGSQATLEGNAEAKALCDEFNALINGFIEIKEPVTVTKKADVGMTAKDFPAVIASVVNSIIDGLTGETTSVASYVEGDYAYNFQQTELYPSGLVKAEKTVNEDGTTDYKFVLKKEAAFYNGDETYGVKLVDGEITGTVLQHDLTADTLYIEAADLGPAVITEARIIYPGATVTAKTDAKGRLVKYDVNMPVEGSGTGKVSLITVTLSVEGYRNEGFTMDYSN